MARNLTALRSQIEPSLAGRISLPFGAGDRAEAETVSTNHRETDLLTGGVPRGAITEICGLSGSGRTSLLMSTLASRTAEAEACAFIDGGNAFDPDSAEAIGVRFEQLLWVRCQNIDQALRATDLILHAGGFGLVALDFGDIPPQVVHHVSLNVWFRFRRAVEHTPTIFVVLEQEAHAKTCASLVLQMATEAAHWSKTGDLFREPHGCLYAGSCLRAVVVRSRTQPVVNPTYFHHGLPAVTLETKYRATG